jgi:phosphate transport system substrate-binding protein
MGQSVKLLILKHLFDPHKNQLDCFPPRWIGKKLNIEFSMRYILLSIIILSLINCSPLYHRKTEIVRIKGSDTMLILATRWAEEYMKLHPNISVYVDGGGTEKGVEALIKGKADICTASRPLRAQEARLLAEKYRYIGIGHLVAKDALSVYLNPENPVQNLSLKQLQQIFQAEITNWSQVDGNNDPILVLIRSPNSGTYLYFKEHVLEGESYSQFAQIMPTTTAVVKAVTENREAIGYGGIAYGQNVFHCKINGVAPTKENVRNDTYPIIRYLYLYTTNTPRGEVKSFIDWVLKDGQRIVKEVGYIPLWEVN